MRDERTGEGETESEDGGRSTESRELGPGAAPLYEREIDFYRTRGYEFTTLKAYCNQTGLL